MKFTKMHGLGNDYVYVNAFEERVAQPASLARVISDRRTGVGSDGLILIHPSNVADVRMEMYNADGSRAEMCGNGIRCVAKLAVERGLANESELTIETDAGVKRIWCTRVDGIVQEVRVDMGEPILAASAIPTTIDADRVVDHPLFVAGARRRITCVSMGNPHAIIYVDSFDGVDLRALGESLGCSREFPEGINVHVVRVDSPTAATVRTWERGSGITRACGTGACAVCVAGVLTKRTRHALRTTLPGGDLEIEWGSDGRVYMTGPAVEVFSGDWVE